MIKNFEQFVSELYEGYINEGFQSRKLRTLIKQHGFPRDSFYRHCLYEIKDEDIIDVVDWVGDYYDKYSNVGKSGNRQATFLMVLKDGTCVVLGKMGIKIKELMNKPYSDINDEWFLDKTLKKRHSERHKGNLGKGDGDDIHKKHLENVDKLKGQKLADELSPFTEDIVAYVKSMMDDLIAPDDKPIDRKDGCILTWIDDNGQSYTGKHIKLDGDDRYYLKVHFTTKWSKTKGREDTFLKCDLHYTLENFEIIYKNISATNDNLGITNETYDDLFKTYTKKNAKTSKNGHSLKNFFSGVKGRYLVSPTDPDTIYD